MPNRSRKDEVTYKKYKKQTPQGKGCPFCQDERGTDLFVEEGKHFMVLRPRFKYTYWDEQDVADQLLLVPKKHVETLKELPVSASSEFLNYIAKFEAEGYSVYARTPSATSKTVPHQHTHLIKVQGRSKRFMFHLRKPYILIMR